MPETSQHAPGTFSWVDSGTINLAKAKPFYRAVFGWEYETVDQSSYTMCLLRDRPVAGLYPFTEDMKRMGAPSYWLPYVTVADADATMAEAVGMGARPAAEVVEAPGRGRAGAFFDPTGALCGCWQPTGHGGFGRQGEHGSFTWGELQTTDTDAAGAFYCPLFGWRAEVSTMATSVYTTFKQGEANRAGMMAMTAEMAAGGVPPNWAVYFFADDIDVTAAAAAAAGGEVVAPPMPVGEWGRMAVLRSADGAYFSILHFEPM